MGEKDRRTFHSEAWLCQIRSRGKAKSILVKRKEGRGQQCGAGPSGSQEQTTLKQGGHHWHQESGVVTLTKKGQGYSGRASRVPNIARGGKGV